MTERKFLSFIFTESVVLIVLGLSMLLLPKLTTITFGLMLCLVFIIYGGYKAINAFFTRTYSRHFLFNIFVGILLLAIGLLLFFKPMFNLILITSLIGTYFILESISTTAFALQTRSNVSFWWSNLFVSAFQMFLGLLILIGLPSTALWIIGILAGLNFLFAGLTMLNVYMSSKYV